MVITTSPAILPMHSDLTLRSSSLAPKKTKLILYIILAIINLRGVSTKPNKYIVFTMQTYKKLKTKLSSAEFSFCLSRCV